MSRGPARKSQRIKALQGTDRKDRARSEPNLEIDAPDRPDWLNPPAKAEWDRIVPELLDAGMLTRLDLVALTGYCHAYGEWQELEKDVQQSGLYQTTQSGYEQKRPAATARDAAIDRCHRFAKEFGFTPKARTYLDVPSPKSDDPNPYGVLSLAQ